MIYYPIIYPICCLDFHKLSTYIIGAKYLFILSVCWSLSFQLLSYSYLSFILAMPPSHGMTIFLYIIILYHRNIPLFLSCLQNSRESDPQNYDRNMEYIFWMFLLDKSY